MTRVEFNSVDDYISAQPEPARVSLKLVRRAIRKALPRAKESISYQMPTYKIDDEAVIYFAGWKKHYSLYPAGPSLVAAFKDDLASCEVNKSTIRFPISEPVPVKLIERIAKYRAREAGERKKRSA
jgi:uncharacterized protein YdhG (YjbR/CyaY superfamily)